MSKNKKDHAKNEKKAAIDIWKNEKVLLANNWIEEEETLKAKGVIRGAIHYCVLGENIGNEQNEERPVIVVSCDLINSTSGNVLVAPLSKTLKKKYKEGKIVLTKNNKPIPKLSSHLFLFKDNYSFLKYDSAVMTEEIKSVSKVRLKDHIGTIEDIKELNRLNVRVRWSLGI